MVSNETRGRGGFLDESGVCLKKDGLDSPPDSVSMKRH